MAAFGFLALAETKAMLAALGGAVPEGYAEAGAAAFAVLVVGLAVPEPEPEFQARIEALSPTRRVPVLHDGDAVVWDSLAICEHANERWLDGAGWPAEPRLRAMARSAALKLIGGPSSDDEVREPSLFLSTLIRRASVAPPPG